MNYTSQLKERLKRAEQKKKTESDKFKPVDLSLRKIIPPCMTRAFENNEYMVMIYDKNETSHGNAIRADLQEIKNKVFGEEVIAVEYYPKKSELIDDYNIYWLWIYPEGVLPVPKLKVK